MVAFGFEEVEGALWPVGEVDFPANLLRDDTSPSFGNLFNDHST